MPHLSWAMHYIIWPPKWLGSSNSELISASPLGSQRWPSSYNNISISTCSDKGWLQHLGIGCGVNLCDVVLGPVPWASFPFLSTHSLGNTPSPFCTAWCGGWGVTPVGGVSYRMPFTISISQTSLWLKCDRGFAFHTNFHPLIGKPFSPLLAWPRDSWPELPAMFSDSSILKAIN